MRDAQSEKQRLKKWGIIEIVVGVLCFPLGLPCLLYGIFTLNRAGRILELPAPEVKPPLPSQKMPEVRPVSRIHAYQKRIDKLQELEDEADRLLASLAAYLDQLFGDSQATKNRYMQTISRAEKITDVNLDKAKKAIDLFGTSSITPQRLELLDGYVASSEKMVAEIETIVTELMRAEQTQLTRDTDALDAAMNELKETIRYYSPG